VAGKIDGKRKIPMSTLLRAIGFGTDDQLLELFDEVDTDPDHLYMRSTIDRDLALKMRRKP